MGKVRIHELAKEFGLTSKEMEARVRKMGFPIKNYMSTLEDYEAQQVREAFKHEAHYEEEHKGHQDIQEKVIKRRHTVIKLKKKVVLKKKPESTSQHDSQNAPETISEIKEEGEKEGKDEVRDKKALKEVHGIKDDEAVKLKRGEDISLEEEGKSLAKEKADTERREDAPQIKEAVKEETTEEKGKERPKPKEKKKRKKKKKAEPKEFAKVIDRKPIEELQGIVKRQETVTKRKDKEKEKGKGLEKQPVAAQGPQGQVTPSLAPQKKPLEVEEQHDASHEPIELEKEPQRKGKKKGKRVVKISELEGLVRKKRPKKQKGKDKLKPLSKLLSEEEEMEEQIDDTSSPKEDEAFIEVKEKGQKAATKPKGKKAQPPQAPSTAPIKASKRRFYIYETIQVDELAKKMSVKVSDVIMKLMSLGVMATANQSIDYDVASIVASEYGFEVEKKAVAEDLIDQLTEEETDESRLKPRPPVVTVMGHVDHGKTTLLDAIRKADVASKEAGGITQHIGAYYVRLPSGNKVVFLDTPGHEAFTQMRARGAQVTDIVVLVVAADDGVMAQTKEAIDHAKASNVPIIVAINKIDKPEANPDRVKTELSEFGLVPEEWGGDTIFVEISAKKNIGIEDFLELLALQAEVMELKANPDAPARGNVIEARLDKGRGPVATLLVSNGTLRRGDALVCGIHYGRVRAMINDKGERLDEATPSVPVEVQGLNGVPEAGAEFVAVPDEKKAREVAEYRQRKQREAELAKSQKMTLETMFERLKEQEIKELNIVLKTDVQGSLEAISDALIKLNTDDIRINLVRAGIGAISESDVLLASASNAIIVGFNTRPNPQAKALAKDEHVEIRFYDVIYHAIEEIKQAMAGMLEPEYEEIITGHAQVRQTFKVPKVGTIAGCYVTDGKVMRGASARLLRENVVVYTGKIESLRRFKDDVKEVASGYECGIGLENFNDIKVDDVIEVYEMKEIRPTL